ncbi:MAG: MFS transporter [Rhodocyclaceae bacterium]|nr:MAG: MFS transporter [Rhodocyclaceae bacterium]
MSLHLRSGVKAASPGESGLSPALLYLLSLVAGASVATVYYAQPLVDVLGREFGMTKGSEGGVITATQIGYALGLVFVVPLGDVLAPKRLIAGLLLLSAAALCGVAMASSKVMLMAALTAVGLLAVVVQITVAFSAAVAGEAQGGRAVGRVTGGVVLGILWARAVAGVVSDIADWRCLYFAAAAIAMLLAGAVLHLVPARKRMAAGYGALLLSLFSLFRDEPLLRVRSLICLLSFSVYGVFWSSLALYLSTPPFLLGHTALGLFGLAGIAGAISAARAGRLADHGRGQWTTGAGLILMLLAWVLSLQASSSLGYLILAAVALDAGMQSVHVTSQSLLFASRPEARIRLAAGYMIFYCVGTGLGSLASTIAYARGGWPDVCRLGAGTGAMALLFWAATLRRPRVGRTALPPLMVSVSSSQELPPCIKNR